MPNVANWIREDCSTVGTGDLVVTGAKIGYITWTQGLGSSSQQVWYTIIDGLNRESGIGTFNGTVSITRDTIVSTYTHSTSTFDDTSPTALSLSGSAVVSLTITKAAFDSKSNVIRTPETTAIDKTLTVTSNPYQTVTAGVDITLPDATTLAVSDGVFRISNTSSESAFIYADGGQFLYHLSAKCSVSLDLLSVAAAAGSWLFITQSLSDTNLQDISGDIVYTNASSIATDIRVCALTDNKAIVVFKEGTAGFNTRAIVVNRAGSTITSSSPVDLTSIGGTAGSSPYNVYKLSETEVVITFETDTANNLSAQVLDIDGTSITQGTPAAISTDASTAKSCVVSSTQMVTAWIAASDSYLEAKILDISGSTITPGTEFAVESSIVEDLSICKLTATKVFIAYNGSVSDDVFGGAMTLSSPTLSLTSAFVALSTDTGNASCCSSATYIEDDKVVVTFSDLVDADFGIVVVSNSVTTISKGTKTQFLNTAGNPLDSPVTYSIQCSDAVNVFVQLTDSDHTYVQQWVVDSEELIMGPTILTNTADGSMFDNNLSVSDNNVVYTVSGYGATAAQLNVINTG